MDHPCCARLCRHWEDEPRRKTADGRWETWVHEEDLILKKALKKYGRKDQWDRIASLLDGRSGEECKDRVCGWRPVTDEVLKTAVGFYGKDQWRLISMSFIHKSPKQCKARWLFLTKQDVAAAAADEKLANPAAVEPVVADDQKLANPAAMESSIEQGVAGGVGQKLANPASEEWHAGCNLHSRM